MRGSKRTGIVLQERDRQLLKALDVLRVIDREQAKLVASVADGAVVGSAIVNQIAQHGKSPELVGKVSTFVKSLADAVKSV